LQANGLLQTENESLKRQLDWLKRQLFGQKSERRIVATDSLQLGLGDLSDEGNPPPAPVTHEIAAHTRRQPATAAAGDDESKPFFDEQRLPVEVIALPNAETAGLAADAFEVISEKVSYRPGAAPSE
jgi:transposase